MKQSLSSYCLHILLILLCFLALSQTKVVLKSFSNGNVLKYNLTTSSFKLQCIIARVSKNLFINLYDFQEQILYNKILTESDIGGDIHRKADLGEIMHYLTLPHLNQTEQSQLQQIDGDSNPQIQLYEFGTTVYNKNKNIPCYKISRYGQITVYGSYQNIQKQKIQFQSKIVLHNVRKLSKMEIFHEQHFPSFQAKITEAKNQLKNQLKSVKMENVVLLEEIKNFKSKHKRLQEKLKKCEMSVK